MLPSWMSTIIETYASGNAHAYLLEGNVQDYPAGLAGASLRNYLIVRLMQEINRIGGRRDVVVYWDRHSGFVFADDAALPRREEKPERKKASKISMRDLFAAATGLNAQLPSPAANRQAQAMMSAASSSTSSPNAANSLDKLLEQHGRSPQTALPLLDKLLYFQYERSPEDIQENRPLKPFRVAVLVGYADTLAPSEGTKSEADRNNYVTLAEWARDLTLGSRGHIILMIAEDLFGLDRRLRQTGSRWEQIHIPFPDAAEREAFVPHLIQISEEDYALQQERYEQITAQGPQGKVNIPEPVPPLKLANEVEPAMVASWTSGLRLIDIHDITQTARKLRKPLDNTLVMGRKKAIIDAAHRDVLTIMYGDSGFDHIGGYQYVKEFLEEDVITPLRKGGASLLRLPSGILFPGPPGTGKSNFAHALAFEAGVPCFDFQLGKLRNELAGGSEARLELALQTLFEFAPSIAFIDEIEQMLQRGNGSEGDSGIGRHFFSRMMQVMADRAWRERGIIWIAATNEPDLLDAALLRRFTKRVPILPPAPDELVDILSKQVQQKFSSAVPSQALPEQPFYEEMAMHMQEGYTAATIWDVVDKAFNVFFSPRKRVETVADALLYAQARIVPPAGQYRRMTERALYYCNDLDLVPDHYREEAKRIKSSSSGPNALAEYQAEREEEDLVETRLGRI